MNRWWEISEKGLSEFRNCLICTDTLEGHPTLNVKNVLKQKRGKTKWYHTTRAGRILHKWTVKNRAEEAEDD